MSELKTITDPKILDRIVGASKELADVWTIIEGAKATEKAILEAAAEDTELPKGIIKALARIDYLDNFKEVVESSDDLQILYANAFKKKLPGESDQEDSEY